MGTVVAIETDGEVAIAGDRQATRDGTVTGESTDRVIEVDGIGAGVVGDEGDIGEFRRQFEAELKEVELERGPAIPIEVVGRIAARIAEETGVEAVVGARDEDGVAQIRRVGPDGSVLSGQLFALGSGAQVALGQLEATDRDQNLRSTEEIVRDVLETVAERDPDTGGETDLWSLPNE